MNSDISEMPFPSFKFEKYMVCLPSFLLRHGPSHRGPHQRKELNQFYWLSKDLTLWSWAVFLGISSYINHVDGGREFAESRKEIIAPLYYNEIKVGNRVVSWSDSIETPYVSYRRMRRPPSQPQDVVVRAWCFSKNSASSRYMSFVIQGIKLWRISKQSDFRATSPRSHCPPTPNLSGGFYSSDIITPYDLCLPSRTQGG